MNGNCKGGAAHIKNTEKNFEQEAGLHEKADFEKAIELAGHCQDCIRFGVRGTPER